MVNFVFLLVFSFLNFTEPAEDYIEWDAERPLTWADFKGIPAKDSPNAALTSSGILADFSFGSKGLSFKIKCRFNKNRSWVKIKTDVILKHEQGHFDITEIFARKFNKALLEYSYNDKTVQNDLQKIYQDILNEHQQWQILYDKETNHSINLEMQRNWEVKIFETLKSLEEYNNYS